MKLKILDYFQRIIFATFYIFKNSFSEKEFLRKILKANSVVIDVGSNLGNFIKILIKLDKSLKIHSIEPSNFALDYQKKKLKKFKNISFHNLAISNKIGKSKFYIRNPVSHSSLNEDHLDSEINEITSIEEIETVTLEYFLQKENLPLITLLKIDTEGRDFEILASSEKLILEGKIQYMKIEATPESLIPILKFSEKNNLKILGLNNIFHFNNLFKMCDLFLENKNCG